MIKISAHIRKFFRKILSSIAFYPSAIALLFLIFSLVMVSIEYKPFLVPLREFLDNLLVKGPENARLILGTLMGSLISLMVFSFSMVMVVLSQASSTLSPRVIPALVGKKYHQVVLGVYLGSIVYCLILITNIHVTPEKTEIPSLGILIAIFLGITCLGMFIYFIDSISRSIQVDTIMEEIFNGTRSKMRSVDNQDEEDIDLPEMDGWKVILTKETGYLKQIHVPSLKAIAEKESIKIAVVTNPGFFLVKNYPFIMVDKPVTEDIENKIRTACTFYAEEHVGDHYLFGFKQISEIAVKALSPGINDPGTAVKAIDLLSILFIDRMNLREKLYETGSDGQPVLYLPEVSLDYLLYHNIMPIRKYGESDAAVMFNILECLKNLIYADSSQKGYERVLVRYISDLRETIVANNFTPLDHEQFNHLIFKINEHLKYSDPIQML
ncbi:DUF2254 domain-containing protein [Fulvivirga sedimenti]|uniref:DUF2254 domain-containing protein n=1 Tax=Fulvivirga sedimenti TaxID=2879465 RepID=A0A9X1HKN2_9BACT|nr:DUF2254 domain-containing protein [Fulvivirga sedimenti]MCA6073641.1 DUF2254 domain-containing protein [Fulvivirga sedimenti]